MNYDYVLVDVSYFCYKSWWKVRHLRTSSGIHSGLEYGFIKNILSLVRVFQPAKVVLVWDGKPARGLAIYPEYKAGRVHPHKDEEPSWGPRLQRMRELLQTVLHSLYEADQEADELIARFVNTVPDKNILIASSDADLHQLVRDNVHIHSGGKIGILNQAAVEEKWGISPKKIPLVRAISGDKSDNIPGIPRIPEKVKVKLVSQVDSLDALIKLIEKADFLRGTQKEKLVGGTEVLRRNYAIINLLCLDNPVEFLKPLDGKLESLIEFCRELEMHSLLERKEWGLLK